MVAKQGGRWVGLRRKLEGRGRSPWTWRAVRTWRGRWCGRQVPGPASACQHPEQGRIPGADFTNTFYLLSSFPVGPESLGLPEFLAALTAQCASLEELKLAFRPQMDPR